MTEINPIEHENLLGDLPEGKHFIRHVILATDRNRK